MIDVKIIRIHDIWFDVAKITNEINNFFVYFENVIDLNIENFVVVLNEIDFEIVNEIVEFLFFLLKFRFEILIILLFIDFVWCFDENETNEKKTNEKKNWIENFDNDFVIIKIFNYSFMFLTISFCFLYQYQFSFSKINEKANEFITNDLRKNSE